MKPQPGLLSVTALTLGSALLFAASASAEDKLPKTGSYKTHNSIQPDDHVAKVGESHVLGSGTLWSVLYDDAGSGPMHLATFFWVYTFDYENGSWSDEGRCVSADTDGDQIFNTFKGKGGDKVGEQGAGALTGGTGKFAGIQGDNTYQCKSIHNSPTLNSCAAQWNYRLP